MKKVKRLTVFLTLVILLAFASTTVLGAENDFSEIITYADNYISADAQISISGNAATVQGRIIGKTGVTTKTVINLYLQQYKGGKWTTVGQWSSSGESVTRILTKTKTVAKGYKYRSKAVCTAYVGSRKEAVTRYSATVNC